jgi:hypothetical protein
MPIDFVHHHDEPAPHLRYAARGLVRIPSRMSQVAPIFTVRF